MRLLRIAMPLVTAVAGFLWLSPTAQADSTGCDATSPVDTIFVGHVSGCTVELQCPVEHRGDCTVRATGIATGTGLVGVDVSLDFRPQEHCLFGAFRCEASTIATAQPGEWITASCQLDYHGDAVVEAHVHCEEQVY